MPLCEEDDGALIMALMGGVGVFFFSPLRRSVSESFRSAEGLADNAEHLPSSCVQIKLHSTLFNQSCKESSLAQEGDGRIFNVSHGEAHRAASLQDPSQLTLSC
jgi:hypothetical protein